jgi:F-type H+-transporting ATPase subunit a
MSAEQHNHSPLAQFEIKTLFDLNIAGIDISYTNSSLMLTLVAGAIFLFFFLGLRKTSLIPNRGQGFVEMTYEFISDMVTSTVGSEGKKYFPLVFSIFLLVLLSNLAGLVPFSFTATSHIVLTFSLAIFAFIIINIIGFSRHGLHYFHLFVPQGAPWWSLFLILPIEVISYLIRPCSLAIRLAVAMTAGHIALKIFAGFVVTMGVFGILPLVFATLLVGLELLVAAVQAYIFSILICVYLNDAVNMH